MDPIKNEEYLNVADLDVERIVSYDKWEIKDDERIKYERMGYISTDGNSYHKYCGYNKFSKELLQIPSADDGWMNYLESARHDYDEQHRDDETFEDFLYSRKKYNARWIDNHICNPNVKYFVPGESCLDRHKNCKLYKTLDNYEIGFVVLIDQDDLNVYLYGMTTDVLPDNYDYDEVILFDRFVAKYEALEIFIGKSIFNEMTDFSGGYGEKWDGNSILIRIGHHNEFRYVYIGSMVFEFVTDEKVIKYISSVGNNCVPYPYAESKNWVYDMSSGYRFPVSENANRTIVGHVFHADGTNSQEIEMTTIAHRGTENIKSSVDIDEPTIYALIQGPFKLCEDTCNNNELQLVQKMNKIFHDEQDVYCASLQDKLPPEEISTSYFCILF